MTQALNLFPCRGASVAVHNGVEFLVITDAIGQVGQFSSDGSFVNLTQLLNQFAFPQAPGPQVPNVGVLAQSVTVAFNPFFGQEVLVQTDKNGVVTVFPPGEAITLFGVETVSGQFAPTRIFPIPIPRLGALVV